MPTRTFEITYPPTLWRDVWREGIGDVGECPEMNKACIYAVSSFPYGIFHGEAIWGISIPLLINMLEAQSITLTEIQFERKANLFGTTYQEGWARWYTDGVEKGSKHTVYSNVWDWEKVSLSLPLATNSTPLYDTVSLGIYHKTNSTAGTGELRARKPKLIFDVVYQEGVEYYDVLVTVWLGASILPNAEVAIKGTTESQVTNQSGQAQFSLKAGTYTFIASKQITDTVYVAEKTAKIPDEMPISLYMEEKKDGLPWWWFIPAIAIGGVIVLATVVPVLTRRRERIILVS